MRVETKNGYVIDAPFVVVDHNGNETTRDTVEYKDWIALPCSRYEFPGELSLPDPKKIFNWKRDKLSETEIARLWGCMYADRRTMQINKRGTPFLSLKVTNKSGEWIEDILKRLRLHFLRSTDIYGKNIIEISGDRFVRYFWSLGLVDLPKLQLYSRDICVDFMRGIFMTLGTNKMSAAGDMYLRGVDGINVQRLLLYLGIPTRRTHLNLYILNNRGTRVAYDLELTDIWRQIDRGRDIRDVVPNAHKGLYEAYYMDREFHGNIFDVRNDYKRFLPPQPTSLTWSSLKYLTAKYNYARMFLKEVIDRGYFYDRVETTVQVPDSVHVV